MISARPESLIEVTGTALSAELLLDLVDDQHALQEARVLAVGPFELTLRMATQEVDVSRLEVELRCRPKSPAPQRVHRQLRSRQTGPGDRVVYLPLERALGRGALQKPFETLPGHLGQRDRPVTCGCLGVSHDHRRECLRLACRLQREKFFQAKTGSREDKEGVLRGAVQLLDYGFQFDVVEAASL